MICTMRGGLQVALIIFSSAPGKCGGRATIKQGTHLVRVGVSKVAERLGCFPKFSLFEKKEKTRHG